MLNKRQMLSALDGLIKECKRLHQQFHIDLQTWSPDFISWMKASESTLETIFGTNSEAFQSFLKIRFYPPPGKIYPNPKAKQEDKLIWFNGGLRHSHSTLVGFRYSVERLSKQEYVTSNPFIFISHGGPFWSHVVATKDLLYALGLSPVVVADLPNLNMSINNKVLSYMGICAGAIILATVEDETIAHEKRTRPNVENEVGSLQALPNIANRIIYLKENGVTFASNYREKVWIPFQKECIEKAFIPIIRELKAFGFIA